MTADGRQRVAENIGFGEYVERYQMTDEGLWNYGKRLEGTSWEPITVDRIHSEDERGEIDKRA